MTISHEKDLPISIEQCDLLHRIANYIGHSLELQETFTTIVGEVRLFLATDRVMIYQFHSDNSGQVVAESIDDGRLPSLLGLNFPADDIPSHAREMFIKSRVRSIVNVETGEIGKSSLYQRRNGKIVSEDIHNRSLDPCHGEYLTAMGVISSSPFAILLYFTTRVKSCANDCRSIISSHCPKYSPHSSPQTS